MDIPVDLYVCRHITSVVSMPKPSPPSVWVQARCPYLQVPSMKQADLDSGDSASFIVRDMVLSPIPQHTKYSTTRSNTLRCAGCRKIRLQAKRSESASRKPPRFEPNQFWLESNPVRRAERPALSPPDPPDLKTSTCRTKETGGGRST